MSATALAAALSVLVGCEADPGSEDTASESETGDGDGDGDPGDGDGDPGDGDGDPGDGDGDPGDGDGDPGPGDGDGDPGVWDDLCTIAPKVGSSECGDGLVGLDEQCDDANLDDTDACSNSCETAHAQVGGFAITDRRHISLAPGQAPDQTRLTLLDTDANAVVHSVDVDGAPLGSSAPLLGYGTALRTVTDGRSMVFGVEFMNGMTLSWTAHVDAQGQLQSQVSHASDIGETRELFVRDDGSAVVCSGNDSEIMQPLTSAGVSAIGADDQLLWTVPFSGFDDPGGVGAIDDGTIVAMHSLRMWTDLDSLETYGYQLTGLDPDTGDELWVSAIECPDVFISSNARFAVLSDDSSVVATRRASNTELLHFDASGVMIGRERWPEFADNNGPYIVLPDDEGGVFVIGTLNNATDDAYVAYWHAEQARRWTLSLDLPGELWAIDGLALDGALEPGERLWLLAREGVVAIGL